jgi:hypothetical protein
MDENKIATKILITLILFNKNSLGQTRPPSRTAQHASGRKRYTSTSMKMTRNGDGIEEALQSKPNYVP